MRTYKKILTVSIDVEVEYTSKKALTNAKKEAVKIHKELTSAGLDGFFSIKVVKEGIITEIKDSGNSD
jgi:hypothetical protein